MRRGKPVGNKGYTMIGVVVVLAALSVAAAALTPLLFLDITVSKEEETRRKLAKLVQVIAGVPEEGTFSFIGDVGRLPKSLEELNSTSGSHTLCDSAFNPGAPPSFSIVELKDPGKDGVSGTSDDFTVGKLGIGYQGPYFREMLFTDDHLKDAWGQKLRYTCPETTKPASDPTTGGVALTLRTGQIVSAGPDSVFDTADDIKSEQFHDRGHLFLTVTQGGADQTANNVTVKLYFPSNGTQSLVASAPALVDAPEGSETTVVLASVPAGARFTQIDFGQPNWERFPVALRSDIANRVNVKIPVGPGGKK